MLKTLLFDLDGTLLSMDQEEFIHYYFGGLCRRMAPHGYDPQALTENIWKATKAMASDASERTNEEVFWDVMESFYGEKVREDLPIFEDFYRNEFQEIARYCPPKEQALQAIEQLRGKYQFVLATNPIFPAMATESRMRWAGLHQDDFTLVTTYENSSKAKPSPAYFQEILEKLQLDPSECLMVGNDADEDGAALQAGIPVFLVTDHLINRSGRDLSEIPHGTFADLLEYIAGLDEETA